MSKNFAISKLAFIRLLENAFENSKLCETKNNDADRAISKCFQHVNAIMIDAVDEEGRGRFFGNNHLEAALFPEKYNDYDKNYWTKLKQGLGKSCSDRLIAVQGNGNEHCYFLEYFIYKVHAFGRHRKREPLPRKLTLDEIIKTNI